MKTAILLSYKGLGTNLLHLSYCHEIAKKVGPITVITLCKNFDQAISNDPLIKKVIYLKKYNKRLFDIFNLSNFLKKFNFDSIYIFYPSLRYYISSKIAGIKNIYCYPIFNKKNLHLVHAAKKFTEKNLNIQNCPTETNLYIDPLRRVQIKNTINKNKKNIILGVGSSGPTTRWGSENFISLINKLNKGNNYFFYLLCGPDENEIAQKILNKVGKENCNSLSNKNISEVVPLISICDLYIGNDSFGQHVAAQSQLPSFIIILDTPKAYSDYSRNQYRILPKNVNENDITHDSAYPASSVSVDMVLDKINNFI
jgi:ADP-heptose:LPS heptosyltransferase